MTSGSRAKTPVRELALRLLAVGGLGVSTLLLVQYLSPAHSLCSHGGCATVRQSSYSGLAGIPTPALGVAFFAGLLVLSTIDSARAQRARLGLAAAGGVAAAGFVAIQAMVLSAYCEYCLAVDGIALLIAVLAVTLASAPPSSSNARARLILGGLAVLSIAAGVAVPTVYGDRGAPYRVDARGEIRDLAVAGKVTIVEFVDFGCPACRAQHAILSAVLADRRDDVVMVYKHLPLPFHPGARDAARAYLCAGNGDTARTLASALFAAPRLGPAEARAAALAAGATAAAYDACIESGATKKTLAKDHADATAMKLQGLPTFWIGDERFEGTQQAAVIRDSIKRARDR